MVHLCPLSSRRRRNTNDNDDDQTDDDDEQNERFEADDSATILEDSIVEAIISALNEVTNGDVNYTTRKAALAVVAEKVTAATGMNIDIDDVSNCIAIAKSRIGHFKAQQRKYLQLLAKYKHNIAKETKPLLSHTTRNTPARIASIKSKYAKPTQPTESSDLHIHRRVADAELALRQRLNQPNTSTAAATPTDSRNTIRTQGQHQTVDDADNNSSADGATINLSAKRKLETLRGAARKMKRRQLESIQTTQQQTQDRVGKSYDMLEKMHTATIDALQTQSNNVTALTTSVQKLVDYITSKPKNGL